MTLPTSELGRFVSLAIRWLDDEETKILYIGNNGCVLKNAGAELAIRLTPRLLSFQPAKTHDEV